MSMNNYAVEMYGLFLTEEDLQELIKNNAKGLIEKELLVEEDLEYLDTMCLGEIFDLVEVVGFVFYGDIEGYFNSFYEGANTKHIDYEEICILPLDKDTLFTCYKDKNEIYEELITKLKAYGMNVDKEYVEKHTGLFSGTYCA